MTESLNKTRKFVSPTYQAKFSHETEGEPENHKPGWVHFHSNLDDHVMKWLKDNFLFRVPSRNPSFHSEVGYAIIGENGSICIIHPNSRNLGYSERPKDLPEEQRRDNFYYQQLTIVSQPREAEIPKALEDKLKDWNYQEVEEFKPYE